MAGNPYYIPPPRSTVGQSLMGIGSILGQARKAKEAKVKAEEVQKGLMAAYESNDPNVVADFVSKNPDSQKVIDGMFNYKNKQTKNNQLETLRSIVSNPDPQSAMDAMTRRVEYLYSVGADPSIALQGIELLKQDPDAFFEKAKLGFASLADKQEYKAYQRGQGQEQQENRVRATTFYADGSMVQSTDTGRRVISPDGREVEGEEAREIISDGRKSGISDTKAKSGAKVSGKEVSKRQQRFIDDGYEASEGYANLKRGLQLLEGIETGGVDKVSIRAKQLFGIESADEAELSNRLSKAVLSQLRDTFGAAFTEKEGDKLDRVEAGFGKSTEGNIRLLKQSMKIIELSAKRGIRAAKRVGDDETAQEIQELLDFNLDTFEKDNKQKIPQQNQQGWQLMTDANGNKAYVSPDGQFEEVK